jgi:hypothetical protein
MEYAGRLKEEYDDYFDDCERSNKIPLSFDAWCIEFNKTHE